MTALAITHVEVSGDTLIGSETFSGETYLQCIIRFPTRNDSTLIKNILNVKPKYKRLKQKILFNYIKTMSTLEQDYTTVPGQLYACLSVIGPEAPQKNDKFGIKIRGAFNSRDEAASHAKRLQKEDATFDIYVVDLYKWLLIPPDPTKIEDVHYTNEKLEELMSGYKENQAQAAQMFSERKRDMIESTSTFAKPGD